MALKPKEKSQLQYMHDNLAAHIAEINLLSQTDAEFNKLEHLINQKQLKIDKIQTFTYISLSKVIWWQGCVNVLNNAFFYVFVESSS